MYDKLYIERASKRDISRRSGRFESRFTTVRVDASAASKAPAGRVVPWWVQGFIPSFGGPKKEIWGWL